MSTSARGKRRGKRGSRSSASAGPAESVSAAAGPPSPPDVLTSHLSCGVGSPGGGVGGGGSGGGGATGGAGVDVPSSPPPFARAHSASKSIDEVQADTSWVVVPRDAEELKTQTCCVCTFDYADETGTDAEEAVVRLGKCHGHYFHASCIVQAFQHSNKCPVCFRMYGVRPGDQPDGTMDVSVSSSPSLSGYSCGTITINYNFPSGTQSARHPSPGESYSGTSRTAYLPDNKEGRSVLRLLEQAFELRHLFTVGTSVTTGRANCVVWNGVHHKTNTSGGPTRFGYPDKTYFSRVKMELAAKGVYEDDEDDDGSGSGHK